MLRRSLLLTPQVKRIIAPTWKVDSSGYIYNDPVLGDELILNGSFDTSASWSFGGGWTFPGTKVSTTSSASALYQTIAALTSVAGVTMLPFVFRFSIVDYASGNLYGFLGGFDSWGFYAGVSNRVISGSPLGGNGQFGFKATSFNGSIDNVSIKQALTGFMIINGGLVSGTIIQIGAKRFNIDNFDDTVIRMHVDSLNNPKNMLEASIKRYQTYFRVTFIKRVNGTDTAFISNFNVTAVANAIFEMSRNGNVFRVLYNGVQVQSTYSVTDVSILRNNIHCIGSFVPEVKFTEIQVNYKKIVL